MKILNVLMAILISLSVFINENLLVQSTECIDINYDSTTTKLRANCRTADKVTYKSTKIDLFDVISPDPSNTNGFDTVNKKARCNLNGKDLNCLSCSSSGNYLNLDTLIGNNNGSLEKPGTIFSHTCSGITFDGQFITANCANYIVSYLDFNDYIGVNPADGMLISTGGGFNSGSPPCSGCSVTNWIFTCESCPYLSNGNTLSNTTPGTINLLTYVKVNSAAILVWQTPV
jgi:hypothetical protein